MAFNAFMPRATTKLVAASSSTSGAEVTQVCTGSEQAMYIANASTTPVYLATAGTSVVQATVPTTATPATGQCIPNGAPPLLIVTPPGGWLSAVTSAGAANVFATPGFAGS